MEMMLDKKQIWAIFLSEYTMGIKQQRQITMSTTCNSGSRSFAKETRVLKMRSTVASNWKLTITNWEASSKLILLQLCKKLLKSSMSTFLWSCCIWSKLERWKNAISRCFMRWPKVFKKPFWSVIFSYCAQQIISGSDCDVRGKVDFIQPATASSVFGPRTPKHFPKPNLYPKKVTVTGVLLPVWSTTAFWIPVKSLHLRSIFSKSIRCPQNYSTCSHHCQQKCPILHNNTRP